MTHRIVIVGGGAGGLELATRLGKTLGKRGTASIMLVDANLTHIWKPLLHEVAAGSLNSSEDELNYVAQAKWNHFEFQLGRMSGLDRDAEENPAGRHPRRRGPSNWCLRAYWATTRLVIAVGSTTNDFGTAGRGAALPVPRHPQTGRAFPPAIAQPLPARPCRTNR